MRECGRFLCTRTDYKIGDDGAQVLADALKINKSVTSIDLTGMRLCKSASKKASSVV